MGLFEKKFAGLEISDYSATLTYISHRGKKSTLKAFNHTILPSGIVHKGDINKPEELKDILRDLFVKANPAPVIEKNIAVCLPDSKILHHIFVFPATLQEKELKHAIPFEIENIIPFAEKDIYWDFKVLYKEKEVKKGQTEARQFILFSAIIKKTADAYTKTLKSIGITPTVYGVQAESIFEIAIAQANKNETTFLIDTGTYTTSFMIFKNGEIHHFSSINEGGNRLIWELANEFNTSENAIIKEKEVTKFRVKKNDTEAVKEEKLNQVVMIRDYYKEVFKQARKVMLINEKNSDIGSVDTVIFSGGFINMPNALKIGAKFFPEKSLETIKPEKLLKISPKHFKNNKQAIPESIYFTNSIGIAQKAASSGKESIINLIPHELKEVFYKRRNATFMAIGTIFMALIGVSIAVALIIGYLNIYYQRDTLILKRQNLDELIQSPRYQSLRGQINQTNFELDILTKTFNQMTSVPAIIEKLNQEKVNGIKITSIEYRHKEKIFNIQGVSVDRETLAAYRTKLEENPMVDMLILPTTTFDIKSDIPFVISITLNPTELPAYGQ